MPPGVATPAARTRSRPVGGGRPRRCGRRCRPGAAGPRSGLGHRHSRLAFHPASRASGTAQRLWRPLPAPRRGTPRARITGASPVPRATITISVVALPMSTPAAAPMLSSDVEVAGTTSTSLNHGAGRESGRAWRRSRPPRPSARRCAGSRAPPATAPGPAAPLPSSVRTQGLVNGQDLIVWHGGQLGRTPRLAASCGLPCRSAITAWRSRVSGWMRRSRPTQLARGRASRVSSSTGRPDSARVSASHQQPLPGIAPRARRPARRGRAPAPSGRSPWCGAGLDRLVGVRVAGRVGGGALGVPGGVRAEQAVQLQRHRRAPPSTAPGWPAAPGHGGGSARCPCPAGRSRCPTRTAARRPGRSGRDPPCRRTGRRGRRSLPPPGQPASPAARPSRQARTGIATRPRPSAGETPITTSRGALARAAAGPAGREQAGGAPAGPARPRRSSTPRGLPDRVDLGLPGGRRARSRCRGRRSRSGR